MADNVQFNADGTLGATVTGATDEIGGVHFPRVKVGHGADGTYGDVSAANPMPVSAAALPLPSGASTETTLMPRPMTANIFTRRRTMRAAPTS